MWRLSEAAAQLKDAPQAWPPEYIAATLLCILLGLIVSTWLLTYLKLTKSESGSADHPYSLSKLQFGLWTIAVAGSYLVFLVLAMSKGFTMQQMIPNFTPNLVWLMGFNGAAVILGKHTDALFLRNRLHGVAQARTVGDSGWSWNSYWSDQNGEPDLPTAQHLVWTVVAITGYVLAFVVLASLVLQKGSAGAPYTLPEVSDTLLLLMAISHGAKGGVDYIRSLPR